MNFELTLTYSAADLSTLPHLSADGQALIHARVVGSVIPGESSASLQPGLWSGILLELVSSTTSNHYHALIDGPFIAELHSPLRYAVRTVDSGGLEVRAAVPIVETAAEAARRRVRSRYAIEPGQKSRPYI